MSLVATGGMPVSRLSAASSWFTVFRRIYRGPGFPGKKLFAAKDGVQFQGPGLWPPPGSPRSSRLGDPAPQAAGQVDQPAVVIEAQQLRSMRGL